MPFPAPNRFIYKRRAAPKFIPRESSQNDNFVSVSRLFNVVSEPSPFCKRFFLKFGDFFKKSYGKTLFIFSQKFFLLFIKFTLFADSFLNRIDTNARLGSNVEIFSSFWKLFRNFENLRALMRARGAFTLLEGGKSYYTSIHSLSPLI